MSDADLYDLEAGLPGSAEPAGRCARPYRAARRCCSRWHEPAPLRLALYLAGFALVQSGLWSGLWAESAEPVWTFGLPGWLCFLIWFIAQRRVLRVQKPDDEPDEALRFERHHRRLRLRENGKERDLCLGRATCVEGGLRIVDWRNAPVSRIFYRYQQGDDYEEEFAGRLREGVVAARRTVAIRDGELDRVEAPEGIFSAGPDGWSETAVPRPRLAGGQATALRAHGLDAGTARR